MQSAVGTVVLTLIVIIIAIAVLWWILAKLYQRSTTEQSLVRTGFLGERVAISGGVLVIPVLHEVTRVNMSILRINVVHADRDALITQDRLRINVEADFYVRVNPSRNAVAAAARTLGSRTASVDDMSQLLGSRFTDALRTAAAQQPMEVLHENRGAYAQRVRELASVGLDASGLEIDSVSISRLDQAAREFFNPGNAFDAAGLTKLTAEIEERRKKRNEIERDAEVAVRRKNLAAEQQMLEIQKEEEYARLQQEREIAIRRAQQQSSIATEAAEMKRDSEIAEVTAGQAVEKARLASERVIREDKLRLEQQVRQVEIDKSRAVEMAETERRKALELAQQTVEIEIANSSKLRSAALADAEKARALAVKAEEEVVSTREIERAQRHKQLALIAASREVEARGFATIQEAQAEELAAQRRAESIRILAQAESDAEALRREGVDKRNDVEARGRRALNEAENVMSTDAMQLRAKLAAIDRIETVVRESARPLERISDIKIVHFDGLAPSSGGDAGGDANGSTAAPSVSDQVMQSALKYKLQAPLVGALLDAAGIPSQDATTLLKP